MFEGSCPWVSPTANDVVPLRGTLVIHGRPGQVDRATRKPNCTTTQYRNFLFFGKNSSVCVGPNGVRPHSGASAARPYTPLDGATHGPTRYLGMFGCGQRSRCATRLLKSNRVWVIYVLVKTPLSGEGLALIGAGRDLFPASVGRWPWLPSLAGTSGDFGAKGAARENGAGRGVPTRAQSNS